MFSFSEITGIAVNSNGDILFTDKDKYCVRRYSFSSDTHDVYAGACGVHGDEGGKLRGFQYVLDQMKQIVTLISQLLE